MEQSNDITKAKLKKWLKGLETTVNKYVHTQMNTHYKTIQSFIDESRAKIDEINKTYSDRITGLDKKYKAMYSQLIREFLVKLEGRVFSVELYSKAQNEIIFKELFQIHETLAQYVPDYQPALSQDEYLKVLHAKHDRQMEKITQEIRQKNVAVQEKENSEVQNSVRQ